MRHSTNASLLVTTQRPTPQKATFRNKQHTVTGLDDAELALIGEALRALRRQRAAAWNAACDAAEGQGRRPPSLRAYNIEPIRHLAKRLGVGATHWMEE